MSIAVRGIRAKPSILRPVLVAVLIQLMATYLTAGSRLTLGLDDTDIYHRYAILMRDGRIPYREYVLEYPPLALPLFLAPALVSRDVAAFKVFFAVEMLAVQCGDGLGRRGVGRAKSGPRPCRAPARLVYGVLLAVVAVDRVAI